jgi:hypothetical protein
MQGLDGWVDGCCARVYVYFLTEQDRHHRIAPARWRHLQGLACPSTKMKIKIEKGPSGSVPDGKKRSG